MCDSQMCHRHWGIRLHRPFRSKREAFSVLWSELRWTKMLLQRQRKARMSLDITKDIQIHKRWSQRTPGHVSQLFKTLSGGRQRGGTLSSYCGGGVSGSMLLPVVGKGAFFMGSFSDLILRILIGSRVRLVFPGLWFGAAAVAGAGCVVGVMTPDSSFSYRMPSTVTRSS